MPGPDAQLCDRKCYPMRNIRATVAALVSSTSIGPIEIPTLVMLPCDAATSAIEASVIRPLATAFLWNHMSGRVHTDRPLEINVTAAGIERGVGATALVARWLSAHALLTIEIDVEAGQDRASYTSPLTTRQSAGGWLARAIISPSAWANAASVTMVSITLAGRLMSCDCLPSTLLVGYNHTPAPAGAVLEAARAGDVPALQAALEAGGSTEEADAVRGEDKSSEDAGNA